jgi:hypothetical protein
MPRRLFACLIAAVVLVPATASAWPPNLSGVKSYISTRAGSVSFSVIGPHGKQFSYRGLTEVPSASVIKVMFLVAYLRQESVKYRALKQWEKDLLSPMIRRSDNLAATRMSDMLGPKRMYRLARRAGMHHFHFVSHPWGSSTVTAAEQARFMDHLERYIPDRHEPYARYLLAHIITSQRWGIGRVAERHPNWRFFFKGGWGSGSGAVEHQVAFLERDGMRIAAAVMITGSPSHEYAKETLRGVFARLLRHLPEPAG